VLPDNDGRACIESPAPDVRAAWAHIGGQGDPIKVHYFTVGDCDGGRRIMSAYRECLYGLTLSEMYVAPLDYRRTIAHELLHLVLGQDYGDRDAEHLRPEWHGPIVDDTLTYVP